MKELRSPASKLNLFLLLSINLFVIILFLLSAAALLCVLLIHWGWLPDNFYEQPSVPLLIFAYVISLMIGAAILLMINSVLIKPMRHMIAAMNELAKGNFATRIRLNKGSHSLEINEFAKSYNKAAEELGSVELLRKDFINNFSHEFKTPIISIKGFAELLREGGVSEEEREEYLSIMIAESDRLAQLANSILELSKLESKRVASEKEIFSVSEQIRRAILMAESKWSAKALNFDLELEETEYLGSARLLNQVWVNILDNAIKFSPDGSLLSVRVNGGPDAVTVTVRDRGPGMDEATLARIFDQFYQGDTSHASEGSGLGMTLVRKILTLHEAEIGIDSYPGEGTSVTVTLPRE
ncbi:sensor histidine kinase [Saccharibacillus alkalitolerans]|uniref:histidine kinase n=1 Tax=Saccharibacillus alkalitolerans TaxID=2705290 RepID=A0ABX0F6L5_9BACL|nr:HAMP domain-containing sensor histidine kinase [Saccharibacillus alkalitolerans]NGZ75243.1 HAMP domain-containing histidine kinase [Saccharibacillus alkalitolerans]